MTRHIPFVPNISMSIAPTQSRFRAPPRGIRQPGLFDVGKVILLGTLWGSAFLAIKIAVEETEPDQLALIRAVTAFLPVALVIWLRRLPLPDNGTDWALIIAMSFFNTVSPFLLISWAQQHIPASTTALIMGAGPLMTLVVAHFTTHDDRLSLPKLAGMAAGFGALLLVIDGSADPAATDGDSMLARLAVLAAVASYIVASAMIRHVRSAGAVSMTAINMSVAIAVLIPVVAYRGGVSWQAISPTGWLALIYLGLLCTGASNLLRFHIVLSVGQSFAALASYVMPVVGVLLGAAVLGEPLSPSVVAALALVLAGFALARRGR